MFKIQGIDKKAKSFWPNICCKERRDTTLEICADPKNEIKRENIIPFALSSGGNYSRHNLYIEVTDAIKKDGYLHKGMKKLLKSLGRTKTFELISNGSIRSIREGRRRIIITSPADYFNAKYSEALEVSDD